MGYHTDFRGSFSVTPALAENHKNYLKQFAYTRRMKRNPSIAAKMSDPIREAVGLPIGTDACNFVGSSGYAGQDHDDSVTDSNRSPEGQPGLWCQWVPSEDGTVIEWDRGEKFYSYIEWIEYLIKNFLSPWGYTLNGVVEWRGEEWNDTGTITIVENKVDVAS